MAEWGTNGLNPVTRYLLWINRQSAGKIMSVSSGASSQISTCLTNLASSDPTYLQCILSCGAFKTKAGEVLTQLTTAQMGAIVAGTTSAGAYTFICPSSTSSPSSACCSAASNAQKCKLSSVSLQNPVLTDCKTMMDQVLWQSYECSVYTSTIVAIVLAGVVLISVVTLNRLVYRTQARLWQRQLWALIIKNLNIWRRTISRHARGLVFAMALIGVLVIITEWTGDSVTTVSASQALGLTLQFRGPSALRAELFQKMRPVAGLLFLIAVTYPISQVVIAVVLEKEQRIREAIRVTGVRDSVALVSWGLSYLFAFLPLSLGLAILTRYGNVFPNIPLASLVLLFTAFLAASTALCLTLSAFFDQTRPAVIGTLVFIYLSHFMAFLATASTISQGFVCLLAPACLAVSISSALADSSLGTGFQRSYEKYLSPSSFLSPTAATAIMFADVAIYYIIAWYLDQIVPQRIGARLPWHFPFHKSFWIGDEKAEEKYTEASELSLSNEKKFQRKISMRGAINISQNQPNQNGARIEDVDADLERLGRQRKCIETMSLTRLYKVPGMANERVAVNRVSMTLYAGHITSVLGHNGAGKTTLISMLCGLVRPTSGDAHIFGLSLRRSMAQIRRSMGMCPQHDILFLDLTAAENMKLFAWLKGVDPSQVDSEARQLLKELGLAGKYNSEVSALSGGQKRKLCVAIALIGGSRVVFLDEPTAGMDPYSRRQTWDVLLNNRKGRVMVLTTHFMDEADILSDRIAIISDGNLCCIGTSLFLKTLYGNGYRLHVTMTGSGRDTQKALVASSGVRDLILSRINGSSIISSANQGQDLIFQLPLSQASQFPDLFRTLDTVSDRVEYGISVTTLEDVFLAVARRRDAVVVSHHRAESVNLEDPRAAKHRRRRSSVAVKVARRQQHSPPRQRQQQPSCIGRVLYQMVIKRWWLARRDYRQPLFLVVLPLLFLLIPIVIPEIQITPILRPGSGSHPSPGPTTCSVEKAADTTTSCTNSASNCVSFDSNGNSVQVRPQYVNTADLANKCTLHNYMGFCGYVPWICSTDVCCNWRDYRSPWYPCQLSTILPSKLTSNDADANWNIYCPRRQYAMIQGIVNGFVKAMAVLMAFVFAPSIIIAHAVLETEKNTKFLQLVSGVRLATYWLGAAMWDQMSVLIGIALATILVAFYSYPLSSVAYFPAIVLIVLFALSIVPLAYWSSFKFSVSSRALTAMLVFNIVTGAGFSILNYILQTVTITLPGTSITSTTLSDYLRYILMVFPAFSLTDGLIRLQNQLYIICVGNSRDTCLNNAPSSTSDIWKNCLYLIMVTLFCWMGLVRREGQNLLRDDGTSSFRKRLIEYISGNSAENPTSVQIHAHADDDEDVNAEKHRVQRMVQTRNLDPLVVDGMQKVYSTGTVALHPLYLSVSAGQCLGFLGINGAGKTTTIKCLTGAIRHSDGHAFIDGHNITTDLYAARSRAGYCPQFDALFDLLTVKEHLIMYSRIRRLTVSAVADVIESIQLGLFTDVPACYLSGGNRRKLSAAIALLGSPRVVYLDEPSTGMDPHAKRFLWTKIANVIAAGKTAVMLTTHSMEECEALCGKVAILMEGRLVGLGSIQHLKQRFGTGYTIEVRTMTVSSAMIQAGKKRLNGISYVTKDNLQQVCEKLGNPSKADQKLAEDKFAVRQFLKAWIEEALSQTVVTYLDQRLPEASLKSRHGPHMVFEIASASLADLFAIMSTAECVEHYAISQTTLEEIFNTFAHKQQQQQMAK